VFISYVGKKKKEDKIKMCCLFLQYLKMICFNLEVYLVS